MTCSSLMAMIYDGDCTNEDCVLQDFLLYIRERERALVIKAIRDSSALTDCESDRLFSFFMPNNFKYIPRNVMK